MSSTSLPRFRAAMALVAMIPAFGCWEQIDDGQWFPQMKRQMAVQAFEEMTYNDQRQGFSPPEGTVPVGALAPQLAGMDQAAKDAIANPETATLASLARGEELYGQICATCHGMTGKGDGKVAGPPFGTGPFGLVLPIGPGAMMPSSIPRYSDGYIYSIIAEGRGRMPAYQRISVEDRWHIVNYLRELNGQRLASAGAN